MAATSVVKLQSLGSRKDDVRFRLSGSNEMMSRADAGNWVRESAAEGFSKVRFIVHHSSGGDAVVELSASTPGGPETEFHPFSH